MNPTPVDRNYKQKMGSPVFLLGAGFNRDARRYVGTILGHSLWGEYEIECNYPVVPELARECFGRDLHEAESIEQLFAAAVQARDFEPLRRLYDLLMKADWYIASRLAKASETPNPYRRFFDRFLGCHFLTFNYDSLPEIFLFKRQAWCPVDGYGVPVHVMLESPAGVRLPSRRSVSCVLHLHGSLCVYARSFELVKRAGSDIKWLNPTEVPNYLFDPHSLARLFLPYRGMPREPDGYEPVEERVIAPIPDKAEGLKQDFIAAVHSRSANLLESSSLLIVIGYRFNELDRSSYDHLLRAFSRTRYPRAVLVSPDAWTLKDRLARSYPQIQWAYFRMTFADWANAGFPNGSE